MSADAQMSAKRVWMFLRLVTKDAIIVIPCKRANYVLLFIVDDASSDGMQSQDAVIGYALEASPYGTRARLSHRTINARPKAFQTSCGDAMRQVSMAFVPAK
jgi:hypothetical protein